MPIKPSDHEEEYFARQEFARRKAEADTRDRELAAKKVEERRKLHYMHCPKCGHDLVELPYQGIQIDRCTGCAGIWLDAGELETMLKKGDGVLRRFTAVFKAVKE